MVGLVKFKLLLNLYKYKGNWSEKSNLWDEKLKKALKKDEDDRLNFYISVKLFIKVEDYK